MGVISKHNCGVSFTVDRSRFSTRWSAPAICHFYTIDSWRVSSCLLSIFHNATVSFSGVISRHLKYQGHNGVFCDRFAMVCLQTHRWLVDIVVIGRRGTLQRLRMFSTWSLQVTIHQVEQGSQHESRQQLVCLTFAEIKYVCVRAFVTVCVSFW